MIEAVLDTNVLVAALRSKLGASYQLVELLRAGAWRSVVSPALALEYEAVLKREPEVYGSTLEELDRFLAFFYGRSRLVEIYFNWRPVLRDPDDEHVLEAAVRAGCPLVTFNVQDFDQASRFGIIVMTPKDLLGRLERRWN